MAADLVRAAAADRPHGGALMAAGDLNASLAVPPELRHRQSAASAVRGLAHDLEFD